jgi:methionyl-tRNA synthetase
LANRPESSDSIFKWIDLAAKNNNELLPNLGNLFNRVLKLVEKGGNGVPTPGELETSDQAFLAEVYEKFKEYVGELDQVHIRNGLKIAMEISSLGNKFLQDNKVWEHFKDNRGRYDTLLFILINVIRLIAAVMEPYIPSFSAKAYEQLGCAERNERDDELIGFLLNANDPAAILSLLPAGAPIGSTIAPIFKNISD